MKKNRRADKDIGEGKDNGDGVDEQLRQQPQKQRLQQQPQQQQQQQQQQQPPRPYMAAAATAEGEEEEGRGGKSGAAAGAAAGGRAEARGEPLFARINFSVVPSAALPESRVKDVMLFSILVYLFSPMQGGREERRRS